MIFNVLEESAREIADRTGNFLENGVNVSSEMEGMYAVLLMTQFQAMNLRSRTAAV